MTVKIYSTPSCVYCNVAKDYFKKEGISYTDYNVAADVSKAEEMTRKSGQMSVPVIDVNGKVIPKRNERSELVHSRMSAGKARVNTPRLAAEREPYDRLRVQGLPWGMIPFIVGFNKNAIEQALHR